MKQQGDVITISGPLLERYVTLTRLTASGIASQMGYTYENINNIMSSISEVMEECIKITNGYEWSFSVDFHVREEVLMIDLVFFSKGQGHHVDETVINGITLELTKTLMDSVSINQQKGHINIMIEKVLHELKGHEIGENHTAS